MYRVRLLIISLSVTSVLLIAVSGLQFGARALYAGDSDQIAFADRHLYNTSGFITMLRVHDVGTGFGPGHDFIDGEVVIRLDSRGNQGFGFQLRTDDHQLARTGMLNLLRDAFNHDWLVHIDFWIEPGKNNGEIIRVWITKPPIEEY